MMNSPCHSAIDHLLAELDVTSSPDAILSELLDIYPDCQKSLLTVFDTWKKLDEIKVPDPSPRMHQAFYEALEEMSVPAQSNKTRIVSLRRSFLRYAVGFLLLVLGFVLGKQNMGTGDQVIALSDPAASELTADGLYIFASTTDRLARVQNIKHETSANPDILEVLNTALCSDPSSNVRLSAIESLLHFSEDSQVRAYLIGAIPHQSSAIVQIALVDAIALLQDSSAVGPLKKVLESGDLPLEVADHYEDAIKILM